MRGTILAAAALAIVSLASTANAQTYYQYQTYPTYRVVPAPAPVEQAPQAVTYPDNLRAALSMLQQAEDQLRAVRLRDNDNRNDAIDKIREARREVEKAIRDNRY